MIYTALIYATCFWVAQGMTNKMLHSLATVHETYRVMPIHNRINTLLELWDKWYCLKCWTFWTCLILTFNPIMAAFAALFGAIYDNYLNTTKL